MVMVFTSPKPRSTAFSEMLANEDSENDHRMKCNLILSVKERGAHPAGCCGCWDSDYGLNKWKPKPITTSTARFALQWGFEAYR